MAEIINFPGTTPPASPKYAELRRNWHGVEYAARTVMTVINDVPSAADLTDEQKFRLQWELEYMLLYVRADAFADARLPADEYRRRREGYMTALGLGHLI